MDRDDDMDFPILGLLALERKGEISLLEPWLISGLSMPFSTLYTAENVAYRNFVMSLWPPESALFRNPFREDRCADSCRYFFGYVAPGNPDKAAELAFYDGSISAIKMASMAKCLSLLSFAAAFVINDIEIIAIGLSEILKNSQRKL